MLYTCHGMIPLPAIGARPVPVPGIRALGANEANPRKITNDGRSSEPAWEK
jgi:hypothetical protein